MKYDTPKQHLRRLRVERFITYLKYIGISIFGGITLWIIIAIMPDDDFVDRLNECYKTHNFDYCNRVVE